MISERGRAAPAGLADSTPPPTPESRGQVDAVAPAREVTPAHADISFGKTPALVTELAPEDKAFLAAQRCTHPKLKGRHLPAWCPDCRKTIKAPK